MHRAAFLLIDQKIFSRTGHGTWKYLKSRSAIHQKNAIEKEREIRGDPLFSACALVGDGMSSGLWGKRETMI